MEYLSTTSLANEFDITSTELFAKFKSLGWVDRNNDKWVLTDLGKKKGGQTKTNPKYGEYIVWPENISFDSAIKLNGNNKLLTATIIGQRFNISSQRLNLLLNELGWIEKTVAGWAITKLGKTLGGKQMEYEGSGKAYVSWPESILSHKDLLEAFEETPKEIVKSTKDVTLNKSNEDPVNDFRKVYPAEYRTKDGHYVRSKAELTIDDSLYLWGIPHAYEKKLSNTSENIYCDFHIPSGSGRPKAVYIEYWGMENDEKYNERKNKKIEIYNQLGLSLIQLNDADIKNIEDNLQKYLLKHGITIN